MYIDAASHVCNNSKVLNRCPAAWQALQPFPPSVFHASVGKHFTKKFLKLQVLLQVIPRKTI